MEFDAGKRNDEDKRKKMEVGNTGPLMWDNWPDFDGHELDAALALVR